VAIPFFARYPKVVCFFQFSPHLVFLLLGLTCLSLVKWFTHKREREREVNFKSSVQLLYSSFLIVRPYCNFHFWAMIWRFYVLTSYFYLLYYYFLLLRLHSLFTFVVFSMCTTGLLTLFASATHSSLCVSFSLQTRLGIGCVFFSFTKSPEKMRKRKLCIPSNKHGRGVFQQVFAS
jgi:hypothetical protein